MNVAYLGAALEDPGKTDRRGVKVGHPVFGIRGATEGQDDDFVVGGGEGVEILKDAAEVDPLKVWQPALPHAVAGFIFSCVSGFGSLRKQERIRGVKSYCIGIEAHSCLWGDWHQRRDDGLSVHSGIQVGE